MKTKSNSLASLTAIIKNHLHRVAPEADLEQLDPEADLGTTLNLDSMDIYTLLVGISEEVNTDIPEDVYGDLRSIKAIATFLEKEAS